MGRKELTQSVGMIAAILAVMFLAACDTQPATDVTESAATLNAKGACFAGTSGTWEYQLRPTGTNLGWSQVGPRQVFSCPQNTGEVALTSQRANYLIPDMPYAVRLVSRLDDGTVQTWDADGTNGGVNYDTFRTGVVVETELPETVEYVSPDADDPAASASSAAGCRTKELKNPRLLESWPLKVDLVKYTLRVRWSYCANGQIVKMYPAVHECAPTSAGSIAGYDCASVQKIRAYSLGGNPEHAVYSYSWVIKGKDPVKAITFFSKTVCASSYVSGSGAHYRNGRCDLVPWGT